MTREEFIHGFYELNPTVFHNAMDNIRMEILVPESVECLEGLHQALFSFFNTLSTDCALDLLKSSSSHEFDWDYSEENPDSNLSQYNIKMNLHMLYDNYILMSQFPLKVKTIYRIENEKFSGLYNSFYASLNVDDNHPSPNDDPKINKIFNTEYTDYSKKWLFAFANIEDTRKWVGENKHLDKLQENGFHLSKITIAENFIIEGTGQNIFQKENIIHRDTLSLNEIKTKTISPKNK